MNGVDVGARDVPLPRWSRRFASFLKRAMEEMGARDWEVSVLLCGDDFIRGLNGRYRSRDSATDVLSFSQTEGRRGRSGRAAGDIVISLETLRRNAQLYGVTRDEELKRLGVHGLLHLCGMDHGRGKSGAMLREQERILSALKGRHILAAGPRR